MAGEMSLDVIREPGKEMMNWLGDLETLHACCDEGSDLTRFI
jgi:hypothetical protein